jgi:hypothetical protein
MDIIPANPQDIQKYSDDIFNKLSTSGNFFPRVQLCGGNTEVVKKGKIGMNHYGMVRDAETIDDLGLEFEAVPLAWRPKALDTSTDPPISSYTPSDAEFTRIQQTSEVPNSGCMYGPEFLLWVPSIKTFVTFFFSSKTARRVAPNLEVIRKGKGVAMFRSKFIETEKYSWQGPVIIKSSAPMTNIPTPEETMEAIERFNNPPKSKVELAPDEPQRAR